MTHYEPVFTKKFKKDLRRVAKEGLSLKKLEQVVNLLAQGKTLAESYRDHELKGKLSGLRECHVESDWLLLYQKDDSTLTLLLIRTGTHAKMFGE